jgi:uncharacterized cupin superfamily protein
MEISEGIKAKTVWVIHKFKDPDGSIQLELENGAGINKVVFDNVSKYSGFDRIVGNIALNEGISALIDLIAGTGVATPWDSANARIGIGDSTVAESATQTGLQGTNKVFKGMDATYPQKSGTTCSWRATFGPTEANFAWNEFTVVNGADDTAVNLNRKVASKGTKVSEETWTVTVSITFS